MASNRGNLAAFRSVFSQALEYFGRSDSNFMVLRTIGQSSAKPSILFVLDSSFNPPTRAHLQIAISALQSKSGAKRLLLLLATQNADKAPKPAAFEDRLVMMTLFGEAVREEMRKQTKEGAPDVDIGITKMPYFHQKAECIDEDGRYARRPERGEEVGTEQVYLVGYDSLVRILDKKYYPKEEGFKVLESFMGKHRLRVTMRTDDQWGDRKIQEKYLDEIKTGKRLEEGLEAKWGERIELVEGKKEGDHNVSSTEARKAAQSGDSDGLRNMVVQSVEEYIQAEGLYKKD